MPEPIPDAALEVWSRRGLEPQEFPFYYSMPPVEFRNANGVASGAVGARARTSRDISNWPHLLIGIRIDNTYPLPSTADADSVARYRACKEYIDDEQTVRIDLAQQNVTADLVLQAALCGRTGSADWHPFPVPFPMAGSNNIAVEVQRVTPYPQIADADVLPTLQVTLVAAVFHADRLTTAVHRRIP